MRDRTQDDEKRTDGCDKYPISVPDFEGKWGSAAPTTTVGATALYHLYADLRPCAGWRVRRVDTTTAEEIPW